MKRNWKSENDESTDNEVTKWGIIKGMQTVWLKYRKEVRSIELINEELYVQKIENLYHRLLIYLTYILYIFNIW